MSTKYWQIFLLIVYPLRRHYNITMDGQMEKPFDVINYTFANEKVNN